MTELNKLLGIHRIRTTAYHPQANGMVERFHRTFKSALMARQNTINWSNELPIILLGIRAGVKEDLKCLPAELVYGENLKLPGEIFVPSNHTDTYNDTDELLQNLRQTMRNLMRI